MNWVLSMLWNQGIDLQKYWYKREVTSCLFCNLKTFNQIQIFSLGFRYQSFWLFMFNQNMPNVLVTLLDNICLILWKYPNWSFSCFVVAHRYIPLRSNLFITRSILAWYGIKYDNDKCRANKNMNPQNIPYLVFSCDVIGTHLDYLGGNCRVIKRFDCIWPIIWRVIQFCCIVNDNNFIV